MVLSFVVCQFVLIVIGDGAKKILSHTQVVTNGTKYFTATFRTSWYTE